MDANQFQAGVDRLAQPVLPLVRLVEILFLTGPFATVAEVVAELNEPIDTVVRYEDPAKALLPYLDVLEEFQRLKDPSTSRYSILDSEGNALSVMEEVDLWVAQQVVTRELESINSQLCAPCRCSLCCIGPSPDLQQVFFSIPLATAETDFFPLPRIDSVESRQQTAESDQPLTVAGRPFYDQGPCLIHWQSGWSMILPTGARCPQLTTSQGCAVYLQRPEVCRRPQIFPYLIERLPGSPEAHGGIQVFRQRGAILAVWDCPYVKRFQAEIALYAERCELEPVFKENKA